MKKEFEVITYRPLDVSSRLEQRRNSSEFENLEPHVEAVCNNIYELRRKDFQEKPLYLYINELKEKFEEDF